MFLFLIWSNQVVHTICILFLSLNKWRQHRGAMWPNLSICIPLCVFIDLICQIVYYFNLKQHISELFSRFSSISHNMNQFKLKNLKFKLKRRKKNISPLKIKMLVRPLPETMWTETSLMLDRCRSLQTWKKNAILFWHICCKIC